MVYHESKIFELLLLNLEEPLFRKLQNHGDKLMLLL